jgi:hypothetical protein
MSFDDGSLGRREDRPGSRGQDRTGILGALTGVYDRLRTHVVTWPGRYVEMRAQRFERE